MPPRITKSRVRRPAPVSSALKGLGDRLREARTAAGLSQAQLGAPHFTRAYISAIELGKVRPAMKSLEFLAAKVGKPTSFFVTDQAEEDRRHHREMALARAAQLIAEGRAHEAIDEIAPLLETPSSMRDRALILRFLGRAYWEMNDGAHAAAHLSEALRLFESVGDREGVIRTKAQLGMALHLLMSYGEAESYLDQALQAIAAGELQDPLLKVHVLHNLGLTFYQRQNFETALQYFERAELEGADLSDPKWLASLFAAVGMARRELEDYDGAVAYLGKSEALFESIRNRSRAAEVRFQRGRTLRALGHREAGAHVLREALQSAEAAGNRHLSVRIAMNVAGYAAEDGDLLLATRQIEQTMSAADEMGDIFLKLATRTLAGRIWKNDDPTRAERVLREAIELFSGTEEPPDLAEAYSELSQILAKRGLAEDAVRYAARAVRFVGPRTRERR